MNTINIAAADRPRCAVRGLVAPRGMCSAIIVGAEFCGSDKACAHKVAAPQLAPRKSLGYMLIATRPCGRMAGFCWDDAGEEKSAAEWVRAVLSNGTGSKVERVERFEGDQRPEEICMGCRGKACQEGGAA